MKKIRIVAFWNFFFLFYLLKFSIYAKKYNLHKYNEENLSLLFYIFHVRRIVKEIKLSIQFSLCHWKWITASSFCYLPISSSSIITYNKFCIKVTVISNTNVTIRLFKTLKATYTPKTVFYKEISCIVNSNLCISILCFKQIGEICFQYTKCICVWINEDQDY